MKTQTYLVATLGENGNQEIDTEITVDTVPSLDQLIWIVLHSKGVGVQEYKVLSDNFPVTLNLPKTGTTLEIWRESDWNR